MVYFLGSEGKNELNLINSVGVSYHLSYQTTQISFKQLSRGRGKPGYYLSLIRLAACNHD